jgi:hypothetical protein
MLSLEEWFDQLKEDLTAVPMRISAYHDLPFAMFVYNPKDEYLSRKLIRLLAISLEQNHGKRVTYISMGDILWKTIMETEGLDAIVAEEKQLGFDRVQGTVNRLLSDDDFMPLSNEIEKRIAGLDPSKDIVFLVRVGALAPSIYRGSMLLDEMHGRTMVPIILFYPGTAEGRTDVRFMGMEYRAGTGAYNYRVKIYGGV